MNYVKRDDGSMSYYDNNGRFLYTVDAQGNRVNNARRSGDFYIKSNGETVNEPFNFVEPKTVSMVDPEGNIAQLQYGMNGAFPGYRFAAKGFNQINGRPVNISQDFVKHSDGTVEKYPRNMQWPAVSGLGDPRRPNGVYMEPPPSSEVPASPALSDEDIVRGILRNEYGTGDERKNKLLNLGLTLDDIGRIQGLVNARMYAAQARRRR